MINILPKIAYDFSTRTESSNNTVVMPDLLVRVDIDMILSDRKEMLKNYFINDGMRLEMISYELYGTADYFWTIMMVNKRYDYISDYPMRDNTVLKHVTKTYGEGKEFDIHHYETPDGYVCDASYYDYFNTISAPKGADAENEIWKSVEGSGSEAVILKQGVGIPITNYEFEQRFNDRKRNIVVIKDSYIADFVSKYKQELSKIE